MQTKKYKIGLLRALGYRIFFACNVFNKGLQSYVKSSITEQDNDSTKGVERDVYGRYRVEQDGKITDIINEFKNDLRRLILSVSIRLNVSVSEVKKMDIKEFLVLVDMLKQDNDND